MVMFSRRSDPAGRPRTSRRRPVAVVAAVLTGTSLLAACGSTSSSSSATTSGSSATTSASAATTGGSTATTGTATGSTIVIGNDGTYSGPTVGDSADVPKVLQAWAAYTNANGGLNGHRVKVISLDNGGSASKAVSDVQTLIGTDHAVALIGITGSLETTWSAYVQQKNIPVIGGDAYTAVWLTSPVFFPDTTTVDSQIAAEPAEAKAAGATVVGTILCSEAAVCAQAIPPFKAAATKLGLKLGYSGVVASNLPSYTATCLTAKQSGDNGIAVGFALPIGEIHMINDCAAQGYKPVWVVPSTAYTPAMLSDPNLSGALMPLPIFPFVAQAPAVQTFLTATQQQGIAPSSLTFSDDVAWAAGQELVAAAKAGGSSVTSASLLRGLNTFSGETLGGLVPPLTFAQGKPHEVNCYFTATISGGKLVAPNGLQTACL